MADLQPWTVSPETWDKVGAVITRTSHNDRTGIAQAPAQTPVETPATKPESAAHSDDGVDVPRATGAVLGGITVGSGSALIGLNAGFSFGFGSALAAFKGTGVVGAILGTMTGLAAGSAWAVVGAAGAAVFGVGLGMWAGYQLVKKFQSEDA